MKPPSFLANIIALYENVFKHFHRFDFSLKKACKKAFFINDVL